MKTFQVEFVEFMPEYKKDGILYISMKYALAIHLCACGCKNEVVTPLAHNGWKLSYDGEGITLLPSIGNWNFTCESHYWIINSQVQMVRNEYRFGRKGLFKKRRKSDRQSD